MSNLLLMSSSRTPDDSAWLHHGETAIKNFLVSKRASRLTFVPYAGVTVTSEQYTKLARDKFENLGFTLDSVTETENPAEMLLNAQAIAVGGGNTFRLLQLLQEKNLDAVIKAIVERVGKPYIGWSAGAVIAGPTMSTTNDMPIVAPSKGFRSLDVFPHQINPHYRDPVVLTEDTRRQLAELYDKIPGLREEINNKGETRDDRIREYMQKTGNAVLALREGAIVRAEDEMAILEGTAGAKFFEKDKEPVSYKPGDTLDSLLRKK